MVKSGGATMPNSPLFFYLMLLIAALMVPMVGLEPTRLSPPPPQDGVSTNSTTSAKLLCPQTHREPRISPLWSRLSAILRAELAGPARRTPAPPVFPHPAREPSAPDSSGAPHSRLHYDARYSALKNTQATSWSRKILQRQWPLRAIERCPPHARQKQ